MSEKTKHTPTPWKFDALSGEISDGRGTQICGPVDCYDEDQWKADAALIVRAVNTHEELLDALKAASHETSGEALKKGRAAIAKAEGRS